MNRPMGVTILAWLAIIGGAFALFGSIFVVIATMGALALVGAGAAAATAAGAGAAYASAVLWAMIGLVMAVWLAVLGVFEIVFGVGALGLKPWAWSVGVIWCYVAAVSDVISIFTSRGSGIFSSLIGIVISIAILYYLYSDEVRAVFGKAEKAAPAFITPLFMWMNQRAASAVAGRLSAGRWNGWRLSASACARSLRGAAPGASSAALGRVAGSLRAQSRRAVPGAGAARLFRVRYLWR